MKITILGNNSALPAFGRHPTSQMVAVNDAEDVMLDCGEGTQMQIQLYGMKWRKLHHIFISHLHGDHYFGLPGLINTMSLLGRTIPLHIYAPAALETILDAIKNVAGGGLCYPLVFHALPANGGLIADLPSFSVQCFPVEHRIECHGFLIETKTKGRKIIPEKCAAYNIPTSFYNHLKNGENFVSPEGVVVENLWVTEAGAKPKKYAYCADTKFTESFLPQIKNADLIYHECTYLHEDAEKAEMRYHSTTKQAAELAKKANAQQLLIGHFSSKYKDLTPFLAEARSVFENTQLSEEGKVYEV